MAINETYIYMISSSSVFIKSYISANRGPDERTKQNGQSWQSIKNGLVNKCLILSSNFGFSSCRRPSRGLSFPLASVCLRAFARFGIWRAPSRKATEGQINNQPIKECSDYSSRASEILRDKTRLNWMTLSHWRGIQSTCWFVTQVIQNTRHFRWPLSCNALNSKRLVETAAKDNSTNTTNDEL